METVAGGARPHGLAAPSQKHERRWDIRSGVEARREIDLAERTRDRCPLVARDVHFLSRLDRLGHREAAVALELYRSPALLSGLLRREGIDGSAARVSVALATSSHGPRLIAARDGQLVTCLAEGMANGPWPVVPRASLDAERASHATERLGVDPARALVASEMLHAIPRVGGASPEPYVQLARDAPSLLESVLAVARRRWDAVVNALSARPEAARVSRESMVDLWCAAGAVLCATAARSVASGRSTLPAYERRYSMCEVLSWAYADASRARGERAARVGPSLNRRCPCGRARRYKRCCAERASAAA